MLSTWTAQRLERLFHRYNQRYWRGRLGQYRVVVGPCPDAELIGWHECKSHTITIDVPAHRTDRQVRKTLLHEMCHAAARKPGHGVRFWAHLEHLLRQGAPVGVGAPEAGGCDILANLVPARFRLVKRAMDRAERRRARQVWKEWREEHPDDEVDAINAKYLVCRLEENRELHELPWKRALWEFGREFGMVDEDGRPLSRRFQRFLQRLKYVHARLRRDLKEDQARLAQTISTRASGVGKRQQSIPPRNGGPVAPSSL